MCDKTPVIKVCDSKCRFYFDKVELPSTVFPSLNSIQKFDMTAWLFKTFKGSPVFNL